MKTVIGFHRPEEINGSFSNWYLSDFVVDGIKYSSMEQYMMHKKALLFKDTEIASQILRTSNPGEKKTSEDAFQTITTLFGTAFGNSLYIKGCLKNSDRMMIYLKNCWKQARPS